MKPILWLETNGDPCGRGFTASESTDGGNSWLYRGDVGAMPRYWWRNYARKNGYTLWERDGYAKYLRALDGKAA